MKKTKLGVTVLELIVVGIIVVTCLILLRVCF